MFAFLRGIVAYTGVNRIVLDVNGVGFDVQVPDWCSAIVPQSGGYPAYLLPHPGRQFPDFWISVGRGKGVVHRVPGHQWCRPQGGVGHTLGVERFCLRQGHTGA